MADLPHALGCPSQPQIATVQDQLSVKGMFPRLMVLLLVLRAGPLLQSESSLLLVQNAPFVDLIILRVLAVRFDAVVLMDLIVVAWRSDFCRLQDWLFELVPHRLVRQVHEEAHLLFDVGHRWRASVTAVARLARE